MPRREIDYSKIVIYKIVCNDLSITDLYVGSTTNFANRKNTHKGYCNNNIGNSKKYQIIRDNGGWDNWSMIQIEAFPCLNGNEAKTRERYWYENLNASLNMVVPSRTNKEYSSDNKDKINKTSIEWQKNNAERVREQQKKYRENNAEKIKERRKEHGKKYREKNREELNRKAREKKNSIL